MKESSKYHSAVHFSLELVLLCLAGCFSIWQSLYSQNTSFVFKNYNVKDGLADNNILSMLQDSRGFMWFGTNEGLSRFDGNQFKNYFVNNTDSFSLPGNAIQDLHEYKKGNLVMICNRGVVMMNTFTDEFLILPEWRKKPIHAIRKAQDGIFAITAYDTVYITRDFYNIFDTLIPPSLYKNTFPIVHFLENDLWLIGNQNELFLYHLKNKTWRLLFRSEEDKKFNQLRSFIYYDKKNKWIYLNSFFDGLFRYTKDGKVLKKWPMGTKSGTFPFQHFNFLIPYNDSLYLVGDQIIGLSTINVHSGTHVLYPTIPGDPAALPSNVVTGYYHDKDGNYWIATNAGVSKINIISSYIKTWKDEFKSHLGNRILTSVIKGENNTYYISAGPSNKVIEFNTNEGKVKSVRTFPINIWYMNSWGNTLLVSGGSKKIYTCDLTNGSIKTIEGLDTYFKNSDLLLLAIQQKNGTQWFSGNADGGLVRIDTNGQMEHYTRDGVKGKFSSGYYRCYAEDKNGDLWFGVNKNSKLLHWDSRKNKMLEIDVQSKLEDNITLNGINDMVYDPTLDCLWMAYDGSGLAKFTIKNYRVQVFGSKDGLPGNYAYTLKFDAKHRLWIATGKGLSCFVIADNKFINFDTQNGLSEDNFTEHTLQYDSLTNEITIGGEKSLMQFNTDSLLQFSRKPLQIYIDKILVNGKAIHFEEPSEFRFKSTQNNIQFSFAAPDLVNGKKMQYSYMLEGSNSEWINNDLENTVSFVNLPAGNYTFHLRARPVGENEWTKSEQPFKFTIRAPWFKTGWFIMCMLALACIALFFVVRLYYRRQFEKKRIALEKELLVEQERTRLAQELHDGLGSMLSGVKHSFSSLKNELQLDADKNSLFNTNIDKLNASIREIRNISHNLYSHGLGKVSISELVEEYCLVKNSEQKIKILFSKQSIKELALTEEQKFHIFRIIQELIENVIKHSEATEAIVQLSYNSSVLYITVEDDGKGFDTSRKNKYNGIGLKTVENRVKSLYGNINIKSEQAQGTSVFIEIPIKK